MITVDPAAPFAGRFCFSDLYGLSRDVAARLIYDGMVFCTEFRQGHKAYEGEIVARDWGHAEMLASERPLGERVTGRLRWTAVESAVRH